MDMNKKLFAISSSILILVLSLVIFKFYNFDENQKNIKFRTDIQQDEQVKNNEAMISKSLINIVENPTDFSGKPNNLHEKSNTSSLSNNSGVKQIDQ